MAESRHAAAEQREWRRGCESDELPPEQSSLGSQWSRERPETPSTTDCTASAAVSLACSSHRVRLLTSRAVTSHCIAPHRLSLGVPRSAAACRRQHRGAAWSGGTREAARTPHAAPTGSPTPRPGCPFAGAGGSDAIAPPCTPGRQAPRLAGRRVGVHAGLDTLAGAGATLGLRGRAPPRQHCWQPCAHLRPRAWLRCSAVSPRCTCAW